MLPKHHLVLFALVRFWARTTTQAVVPSTTEAPSTMSEESATNTATGTGVTTHTINVGAAGHKFSPNDIKADVGDILEYRFYPDAHWVIRGDFDYPCIPYEYVGLDRTGFSSGRQPVKAITDDAPRFRVRVNNTNPIFYYCGAPGSCVRYHMMGVVNPSRNETLDGWLEKANDVDTQLTPGEPFPTEEGFKTSTTSAAPDSTTSATPDPTGGSSNNPGDENGHSHGLSAGAVAGIAIGGAAVLILTMGIIYLCGRRGGFDKAYRKTFGGSAVLTYPKGAPPVVEAEVGSPNAAAQGIWVYKPMAPKASSSGQSPRTSSPLTPVYNFPQDVKMMSQDRSSLNTHCVPNSEYLTTPPSSGPPKEELIASAELPVQKLAEPAAELPASANIGG
ncbi:hypothetical protein EDB81DRAFT_767808 [Dactylonectria macrodidyma]|uniref:Extracellular serine-rich protein n=1 Tax=Dactylonectria macrodidyma TaxID=307937 RepID=A0A9P9D6Q3_9HYPO|nr:hypothetical protein EDB81DRAFT_767808 [Dactylonectria macrodidyma]